MRIEAIESAAAIAWPPGERAMLGEWQLSAGDGFSRRRNSAVPIGFVPDDLNGHMRAVADWYAARELDLVYRLTPLCDPAMDDALAQRGFSIEDPVVVMTRSLSEDERTGEVDASSKATDGWIAAELDALGIDRALVEPWITAITAVPSPASFVTSMHGSEPVGAGFGVIVDGLLGVFEMAVRPDRQRRGHAKEMMAALHSFGYRGGAEQAYLQVVEDNDAAVDLYRSMGYEVSHRYWYRRAGAEGR
ncbi:MAG: GNAT family N-acetyltransferase [Actinomycetota bacterium]|nr:GNAT family N-acetyltransferase [Actinomycetota bacterium]